MPPNVALTEPVASLRTLQGLRGSHRPFLSPRVQNIDRFARPTFSTVADSPIATQSSLRWTMDPRSPKRLKVSHDEGSEAFQRDDSDAAEIRRNRAAFLNSISRAISPPGVRRSRTSTPRQELPQPIEARNPSEQASAVPGRASRKSVPTEEATAAPSALSGKSSVSSNGPPRDQASTSPRAIPSPFKLMTIQDLPSSQNKDSVSLHDILGNPLIKEAWIFNFCFDVDWLMNYFDADVRSLVKVKVVHGSWKKEDGNRIGIEDACRRWPNVEPLTAYLPDPFGTHHSKLFVLFTHDDQAEIIIHTANMLSKDWSNMTQAMWRSPPLPKLAAKDKSDVGGYGSGSRFKRDFMAYLNAYGSKARALREELRQYDFSAVRGALVASVPSHMKDLPTYREDDPKANLWGYPRLCHVLKSIRRPSPKTRTAQPHLVCQVSSIATLLVPWLNRFFTSIFNQKFTSPVLDHVSIIYPTPSNVASSLDGYAAGGSIHTKAQSPAHLKQITSLHGTLCQWTKGPSPAHRAGRHEAAPHIKTYVQYREVPTVDEPAPAIDWALLTSANLSTQAWGAFREKEKAVVVQSYELGVLVWPELFSDDFDGAGTSTSTRDSSPAPGKEKITMIPVFGTDTPPIAGQDASVSVDGTDPSTATSTTTIGLRIPYDLPLTHYSAAELPWSPQSVYEERDRHGRRWPRDFLG